MAAKKKYSMTWYVKKYMGGWDWDKMFMDEVKKFVDLGEHPNIDFSGTPIEFANQMYAEGKKRLTVYGGAYFTPLPVALDLVDMVGARPGMTIFDPCAGIGNLMWAAQERGAEAFGFEIQLPLAHAAQALGFDVELGDSREKDYFHVVWGQREFTQVVVNPPFGNLFGSPDIAVDIMTRIHEFGKLAAAILPNGWWDKPQKKYAAIRERFEVLDRVPLPDKAFAPLTNISAERLLLRPT